STPWLEHADNLLPGKGLVEHMLKDLIAENKVKARVGHRDVTIWRNVKAVTVCRVPQLQVVQHIISRCMRVAGVEQPVDTTASPAAVVKNPGVFVDRYP